MLHEIKLIHEIDTPKGERKKVCETYLFDAEFISECEKRALIEFPDCEVVSVVRSKIIEIVNENVRDGAFYKAKVSEVTINDDDSESTRSYNILCNAKDLQEATKIFTEHMKSVIEDSTIDSIVKTRIVDIL